MSPREVANLPASARARLLNLAREQGESFDQLLVYYAIERFLYRLSRTQWGSRLVVKGATMLRAWGTPLGRPTRDIDFQGYIDNSAEAVTSAVQECLAVEYPQDGLVFDQDVRTEPINVDDRYPGVRATVSGHLDGARFKVKLDVGIDNAVMPDPEWVEYPTLLDLDAPQILAYLPDTAVAEKYETMVSRGEANSRMKDFYDVWLLSRTHEFDGRQLADALTATFGHRGTPLSSSPPPALTPAFSGSDDAQAQWRAFLRKSAVTASERLSEVCADIIIFIVPAAAAAAGGTQFDQTWRPSEGWS